MRQPFANFQTHTSCTKRTRELDDRGVVNFHDRRLKRSKYSNTQPTTLKFKYLFKYFSYHYTFGSMTPLSEKKQTLDPECLLLFNRRSWKCTTPLSSSSRVLFVTDYYYTRCLSSPNICSSFWHAYASWQKISAMFLVSAIHAIQRKQQSNRV